jgi:hypothetical protein
MVTMVAAADEDFMPVKIKGNNRANYSSPSSLSNGHGGSKTGGTRRGERSSTTTMENEDDDD